MILVRGFATETNGVWALYITLFSLFEAVKQGLLRNATIKFLGTSLYSENRSAVLSASLLLNILFSAGVIILLFVFGRLLSGALKADQLLPLLWWSPTMIILLIPFSHCEILLQANYRFSALFRATFIRQAVFFGGVTLLYFFLPAHFTLLNILLLQVIALLAGVTAIYLLSGKGLTPEFVYDRNILNKIFHFGKFTFGTNLFAGLSRSFDHFVTANALDTITGKNYVAYYNTVARINNMVDMPSLAAADVLYPKNVEALENQGLEKVRYYFEQMVGTIIAIILPVSLVIFIFPRLIIYAIAGPAYYPAIPILQLTVLFSMVRPLSYQFGSTMDAIGKPQVNFWTNGALMAINLALTYTLLKMYGGIGAAYAIMIYYSLSFSVMILILKRYLRLELRNILVFGIRRYKDIFSLIRNLAGFRNEH